MVKKGKRYRQGIWQLKKKKYSTPPVQWNKLGSSWINLKDGFLRIFTLAFLLFLNSLVIIGEKG